MSRGVNYSLGHEASGTWTVRSLWEKVLNTHRSSCQCGCACVYNFMTIAAAGVNDSHLQGRQWPVGGQWALFIS